MSKHDPPRRGEPLPLWVVYENPDDLPSRFVSRMWLVEAGGALVGTGKIVTAPTLDAVRAMLPPGLVRLPRQDGDVPCIVETWI